MDESRLKEAHTKIGELTLERDFFGAGGRSRPGRLAMVDPKGELGVARQCIRSSLHYDSKGESETNLALTRRIEELYMDCPFYSSRQMSRHLSCEGPEGGCPRKPCPNRRRALNEASGRSEHRPARAAPTQLRQSAGRCSLATRTGPLHKREE